MPQHHSLLADTDYITNSDGADPEAGLILSGNTLYGTAYTGGSSGNGTVFSVNTDGTGFTNLYSFTATDVNGNNSDGANPDTDLTLSGGILYGAAVVGGSSGNGAVFAVNINGTSFTNLHSFSSLSVPYSGTNSDGADPESRLFLSGGILYGTAARGGSSGSGTVFALNTDGTGFTNLYSFIGSNGGAYSFAGVVLSGNILYGTVFSLSFTPQLAMISSGANVILTWPTNVAGLDYTGYTLQSTTNLASPAVWNTVSPAPVVINGENTITNPVSGRQQFFRLSSP